MGNFWYFFLVMLEFIYVFIICSFLLIFLKVYLINDKYLNIEKIIVVVIFSINNVYFLSCIDCWGKL